MEKVVNEIKNVVQKLLDDEENYSGWYIQKEFEKQGIKFSRTTIANLRSKKTSIEDAKFETIVNLYNFAKTHENKNKE
ncbi:hypothetical protein [Lactococcus lactis]|uniref:hypothetical protein n=1 Tax=Lactococcus lactis TaxID=1358 RepID=UPI00223B2F65|nr:hypothetical protein [Lactococcus lactis]MCT0449981.1 hypothetical protein [Lactococcus lactis subsp. lactis]